MACRICLEPDSNTEPFIQPCSCIGHLGNVHKKCLQQWINIRKSPNCEICKSKYDTTIVTIPYLDKHKYQLIGEILLGNALSLISCYSLWLQQLMDKRGDYNIVTVSIVTLCQLLQIIIWTTGLKNGHIAEFICIPLLWFCLFVIVEMLLMFVSDIWDWNIIFIGSFCIHGIISFMMSCISLYKNIRRY